MNASRQIANGRTTEPSPCSAALLSEQSTLCGCIRSRAIVALMGNKGVKKSERRYPFGPLVAYAGEAHPAVAVTDEDHLLEVILDKIIDNRSNGLGQSDGPRIARPIAHDCRRE